MTLTLRVALQHQWQRSRWERAEVHVALPHAKTRSGG